MLVLDLLGGHAAESTDRLQRRNVVTGSSYLWEQEAFEPVSRQIHCHMSLTSGKQAGRSCLNPPIERGIANYFAYNANGFVAPHQSCCIATGLAAGMELPLEAVDHP